MAPTKSHAHVQLGATIREVRQSEGLTIEDLARRIRGAVSVRYLAGVERGEANVSFANLLRICAGLNVELLDLVTRYADRDAADDETAD